MCINHYQTSEDGRVCPDAITYPLGGSIVDYVILMKDQTLGCYNGYFKYSKLIETKQNPVTGWYEATPADNDGVSLYKIYNNYIIIRQPTSEYRCDEYTYESILNSWDKETADECKSFDGQTIYITYLCQKSVGGSIKELLKEYKPFNYSLSEIDFSGLK